MRRLPRTLLNATTMLSLLLCVATVALWVRSRRHADEICFHYWEMHRYGDNFCPLILSVHGQFRMWDPWSVATVEGWWLTLNTSDANSWNCGQRFTLANLYGFEHDEHFYTGYGRFAIPHWSVVGLMSILPLARIYRWNRNRLRVSIHRCSFCGYDLRVTPDRCPECGAVPIAQDARLPGPGE